MTGEARDPRGDGEGEDAGAGLDAITALAEPNRRALYELVVEAGEWTSRDQAAEGTGLQRSVAAHHLDRLAEDGLLEVDYRRLGGRSGPGAGRPSKLYRRARREFEVNLPPRDYELAGRLLADAVADAASTGRDVRQCLDEAAREEGERIGREMREVLGGGRRSARRAREAAVSVLRDHGFEPDDSNGTVTLRNCPFHRLAKTHTDLICGMNHCLISAAVDELGAAAPEARLEPADDVCCVRLHER